MTALFIDEWYANVHQSPDRPIGFCGVSPSGFHITDHLFAELDAASRRVAAGLDGAPGEPVILALEQEVGFVQAFLGCMLRGRPVVPLPAPSSGRRGRERFVRILAENPGAQVLTSAASMPAKVAREIPGGRVVFLEQLLARAETYDGVPELSGGDTAIIQYTSGSLAAPKGVPVSHDALAANLRTLTRWLVLDRDDVGVSWIPFYHDMGLVGSLLLTLYRGVSTYFMAPLSFLRQPARWLELIERVGATMIVAPDFAYRLCAARVPADWSGDLSSVRVALNGSEPINPGSLEAFEARFSGMGFDPGAWMPCYGLAEATLLVSARRRGEGARIAAFSARSLDEDLVVAPPREPRDARRLVSVGVPVGSEISIRQDDAPVAEGQVGDIHVAGPSVFGGHYVRRFDDLADQTARPREVWHATGDVGFIHAGELYVCGRRAELISRNGVNYHAVDVERTLAKVCGMPLPAAAFGLATSMGDEAVILLEVPAALAGAAGVSLSDSVDRWGGEVASLVGLPRVGVAAVRFGSLPKTTSGKVQRGVARREFLAGTLTVMAASPTCSELADLARRQEATAPKGTRR